MACPSCAGEPPAGARFCPYCGAALAAAAVPAARADERRMVSVLFCDLVGSTALSGRLDPEALRSVTLRYFELMTERIEAHGGRVEKFIGDAVMAVFGIPVMHEDDARRAAAAALDMVDALAGLNDRLAVLGVRLNVRIGVNTGEAVASTDASARQALVSGEVVNVAARLEQNAAAGEILIGPDTLRAIGPNAALTEPAGPLALKGKTEPVPAHRLLALHGDAPELLRRFDTPFVGREAELRLLDEALARTVAGGARLLTVHGEAGLGKTRLVREWLARTGVRHAAGRCRPYGDRGSLAPLADAIRPLLDGAEHPLPAGSLRLLEAGLLRDGTPDPSVEETCAALVAVLGALTGPDGLVLVVDDFHWAGALLRTVLRRLSDDLAARPVLLLCPGRPELLDQDPEWARRSAAVALGGLSDADCARLAAGLVEVAGHGAEAGAALLERAEGNPLHLEQLLAMAAEGHGAGGLPPTVQALLGARIDALAPPERTTLALASVVGRDFHTEEVTGLALGGPEGGPGGELRPGPAGADPVLPALHRLDRRRLVEPAEPDGGYRFRSGLVQEVSYRGTAKRVRAERHERAAELLASRGAPDGAVGGHLALAHRYRTELGLLDARTDALRGRAADRLAAAGATALRRADLGWAEELLDRAVGLYRPQDPGRAAAAWRLAEVRLASGRTEEGRALLAEAAAAGDAVLAAHAGLALAVLDPGPGLHRAADAARAALPLFEAAGDDLGTARACLRLAQERQLAGRHGEAEQLLRRALDGAVRADAEPERAGALGAVGVSLWTGPVPVPEAVERCRALLARHGAGRRTVRLTLNCPLAVLLALQERWAQARACLAEAERLARELAFAEAEVFLPVFRAAVHAAADRPRQAVEELRQAERACRVLGAAGLRGPIARGLARSLLDCGDTAAAEDALRGHQDDLPPADAADLHGTLARLAALRGRPRECAEQLRRCRAAAGATDSPVVRATAALDEAQAALALGDPARAARAAAAAGALHAAKGHAAGRRRAAALAALAERTAAARTEAAGTTAAGTTQEEQR